MPLVTPDITCEWRMGTGLFKGVQNKLILKYLHKSSMRDSHLCLSHSGCAVSGIHTPLEEARTNGQFCWVCSGTELKKNSDRQNNPDLDNDDKLALYSSLGYSSTSQIHSWYDFFFLCLSRVYTHLILEQVNHSSVLKRFQEGGWKAENRL